MCCAWAIQSTLLLEPLWDAAILPSKKSARPFPWLYVRFLIFTQVVASGMQGALTPVDIEGLLQHLSPVAVRAVVGLMWPIKPCELTG
jgi:hypothetical protein